MSVQSRLAANMVQYKRLETVVRLNEVMKCRLLIT